jgi:pyruvate formate lyase activating enzyme
MYEALLYEKTVKNRVQCHVCEHHCIIPENSKGICQTRQNIKGKLYSLVYGQVIAENIDPIEKKPLFHFLPGTLTYSYATMGCNFHCANCHNWQISQFPRLNNNIAGNSTEPAEIVKRALENNCPSISATYTEPTIYLEYALDVMKMAKKNNLKNIWVSNGYMSDKTLKSILPYLDAINIDLKFFHNDNYKKNCGAKLKPILDNLITLKKNRVWVEITTLAIPTLSDSKKMFKQIAEFIVKKLGKETPWHISAFSSDISYKLQKLSSTPKKVIQDAVAIGHEAGLSCVYAGNVSLPNLENTYCPHCQKLLIKRSGYNTEVFMQNNKCANCANKINIHL